MSRRQQETEVTYVISATLFISAFLVFLLTLIFK